MVNINGATALVTGGQRGLGQAFVRELLDRGAGTVYAAARNPKLSRDPRIVPVTLGVTDGASVRAVADLAGDVSIVINTQGSVGRGRCCRPTSTTSAPSSRRTCSARSGSPGSSPPRSPANGGSVGRHPLDADLDRRRRCLRRVDGSLWSAINSLRLELAPQGTLVVGMHVGYADTDLTAAVTAP